MKFPSFSKITNDALAAFKRFPFAIIIAAIGTAAAIWLVEVPWDERNDYLFLTKLCFVCALGIAIFLSVTTLTEQLRLASAKKYLIKLAVLFLLILYYFMLDDKFTADESEPFIRYMLFFLAAHLFVSFAPFLQKNRIRDFWEYNKTLFLRFLTAALFSVVLFAGLSIALLSLDNLLEIEIDGDRYAQLWLLIAGVFNTWFFLSGIPQVDELNAGQKKYPRGLKIFVQYILIPLVSIYIIILYLYLGKIVLEWELPNGWVANLILGYSIAGIFSLLLLYPIRNVGENRWIRLFSKSYYLALIPLIFLLGLSIWVRISEYGITVNRYFVVILAIWLTGIVIYFLASSKKNIKVIPISLFIVALSVSFGPQGAFSVSVNSQLNRIEQIIGKNGLWNEDNKIMTVSDPSMSFEDQKQLSSAINYVINLKGLEAVQYLFEQDLKTVSTDSVSNLRNSISVTSAIMELMNLEYIYEYQRDPATERRHQFYFSSSNDPMKISGYDVYIRTFNINEQWKTESFTEIKDWRWEFDPQRYSIILTEIKDETSIEIPLTPFFNELNSKHELGRTNEVPAHEATVTAENELYRVLLHVHNASGNLADSTLSYLNGSLFISEK